jgi:hypothetical protein
MPACTEEIICNIYIQVKLNSPLKVEGDEGGVCVGAVLVLRRSYYKNPENEKSTSTMVMILIISRYVFGN